MYLFEENSTVQMVESIVHERTCFIATYNDKDIGGMRGGGAAWAVRLRTLCVVKSYSVGCVNASIMRIHSWIQIGCCLGSGLADSTVDFSCTQPSFLPQPPCKIDMKVLS